MVHLSDLRSSCPRALQFGALLQTRRLSSVGVYSFFVITTGANLQDPLRMYLGDRSERRGGGGRSTMLVIGVLVAATHIATVVGDAGYTVTIPDLGAVRGVTSLGSEEVAFFGGGFRSSLLVGANAGASFATTRHT